MSSLATAIGRSLATPFKLLALEPMCLALCMYSAILLGILYLFFGAFPLIFSRNYGFNQWQVGFSFLGIGVGLVLGVLADLHWRGAWERMIARMTGGNSSPMARTPDEGGAAGAPEPEIRLVPAIVGAPLASIGLFIFAWTSIPEIHWMVPIVGSIIFGVGYIPPLCFHAFANMA